MKRILKMLGVGIVRFRYDFSEEAILRSDGATRPSQGKDVRIGDRPIFQVEFSDSLFGATFPNPRQRGIPVPALQKVGRDLGLVPNVSAAAVILSLRK